MTSQTRIPDDKGSAVAEDAKEDGEDLGKKSLLVLAQVLPHARADKVLQSNCCQRIQPAADRAGETFDNDVDYSLLQPKARLLNSF